MTAIAEAVERAEVGFLRDAVPGAVLDAYEFRGDTRIVVAREQIVEVLTALRDSEEFQYNFFSECFGADYLDVDTGGTILGKPHRFEVTYNLLSLHDPATGTGKNTRIFIKVGAPEDDPVVPTVVSVYRGAEFPEREIYDMFGVRFSGHPDLRRILMSDDWVGHPQRKDYPLGGEKVEFPGGKLGPSVEDRVVQHAGESFSGKTASDI